MIRTTRWSPDTCGCVVEYEWDDSDPPETRQHTYAKHARSCKHHSGDAKGFEALAAENALKNVVLDDLSKVDQSLADAKGNPDTDKITWQFNDDRKLIVSVVGLKPGTSETVESKHGSDKVQIA